MRLTLLALTCCGAALLATPDASAVTCYLLFDRNDNVVYQDIFPPFDLSDSGANERNASRARNEHMVAMESDRCPRLELVAGVGTGARINLENMGDPMIQGASVTSTDARGGTSAKPAGTPAAAPKSAPPKAPAKPAKGN